MEEDKFKRNIAYKFRIGQILGGKPFYEDDRLRYVEIFGKKAVRVNIIGNIIDKFIQDSENKFGSITLDDASGQIKLKFFGDDVEKLKTFEQGDTILVIGLLRAWNNEIYITPEILKKKDPKFLLVRKLEVEKENPVNLNEEQISNLKNKILEMLKEAEKDGGIDIDKIILELKEPPEIINSEVKKLLEDGTAYEPRPGKLRYLG